MTIASSAKDEGDGAGLTGGTRLLAAAAAVLLVVGVVVGLAIWNATGDDDEVPFGAATTGTPGSSAPPEPTASTTLTPEEAAAVQEVLATYRAAIKAAVLAQEVGDPNHPELDKYYGARTPALLSIRDGIERNNNNGRFYSGELLVVDAKVAELDLSATVPSATVESCLDDTRYDLVFREDGSPVPDTASGGRYAVTSTLSVGDDGRWYVVESIAHWDEPC